MPFTTKHPKSQFLFAGFGQGEHWEPYKHMTPGQSRVPGRLSMSGVYAVGLWEERTKVTPVEGRKGPHSQLGWKKKEGVNHPNPLTWEPNTYCYCNSSKNMFWNLPIYIQRSPCEDKYLVLLQMILSNSALAPPLMHSLSEYKCKCMVKWGFKSNFI